MWLLTIGTVVVSASSLQVEGRERLLHPDVALTDELQGSIAAALQTIADDQKLVESDRAVFMQDGMTITKTNSTKVQSDVTRHSAWELVAEDLVQKRFGNSSAAKGLEALLGEARAAEVSMTDWQQLALAIAALTPKNVLGQKEAGPSHAFPARHVVRSAQTPKAKQRYESYEAMDDQWNEWTIICMLGLIVIMLTSFVTANKRSQPGKMSRMLELETRWKLTGSSTAGHLSLLRQAAQAAQAPPPSSSTQDLSVWDATVNLFSCLVGTGLLAMPYAFSLAGLIAAPLVLIFVTCSAYTAHLMVWAMQAEESRRGVPSGRLAIGLDWLGLAHAAFGPKAKKLVELFLIVELWGYLLSTVVCASLNITQLGIATNPAVALSVTGAFALTFVPVKLLTKVNVLSNLVYIASALMFVATGILLPQKAPPSEIQTVKPHGLLAAAGILIFSPAGHSFYPRLIQQMEEPSKFPSCIKRAYSGACVVYLLIAVPGYLLFGDAAQPSAVRNIGLDRALVPLPDLWWMNTLAALGLVVKLIPNQAILKALKGHISFIELDSWSVPASTGDDRTAALALRRLDDVDDQMDGAQEAVARVMDQHFTTEAPLLTAERLDALREVWGEAEAKKTVEEAHVLLFPSAAEQAEYPMELFLEDLAEFLQTDPSKATLSLVDAEKFLGENQ